MNLVRFDPYSELSTLQDRFNRAMGSALGRSSREDETLAAWVPPVDITEEKDRILNPAELPGFQENEISNQTENGMLTISGERKFEKETEGRNYHRVERAYGQFLRSFSLPNNVDREKIKAGFKNGLLKVELPKREDAKPKSIQISADGGSAQISGGSSANRGSAKKSDTIDVQAR
jgi:HSP20 family protein